MSRLDWVALVSLSCAACVRVPNRHADGAAAVDASLDAQLAFDAGPRMPEAGQPYRGPECDPAPAAGPTGAGGTASAADDAGVAAGGGMSRAPLPDGAPDVGPAAGAGGSAPDIARHPLPGEIVITEIMSNPAAVRDDAGEWFELHNPGARALELGGCTIDDGAATPHMLAAPLPIAAGAYVVVARGADAGLVPDATLSFSLGNTADVLALVCDGQDIDRVSYGAGFPLAAGASMSLDPAAGASENDAPGAWCLAQASYAGDRGTPGTANPPCDSVNADGGSA